ncbi:unnamed protein product, partial [Owenia fusiformis]
SSGDSDISGDDSSGDPDISGDGSLENSGSGSTEEPNDAGSGSEEGSGSEDDEYTVGQEIIYECLSGYEIADGDLIRVCSDKGTWTGSDPVCTAIQTTLTPPTTQVPLFCDIPEQPPNTETVGIDNLDAIIVYKCYAGMVLMSGDTTRTCSTNGSWSGEPPVCIDPTKIECGDLETPENVVITNYNGNRLGSVIFYECEDNYVLTEGDLHRVCFVDGTWSNVAPVCTANYCEVPPMPENAVIVNEEEGSESGSGDTSESGEISGSGSEEDSGDVEIRNGTYQAGSKITYSCDEGYGLESGDLERTCTLGGIWTGSPPLCTALFCANATKFMTDNVEYVSGDSYVGDTLVLACATGYELTSGSLNIECTRGGIWKGDAPVCTRIVCQDPGIPDNSVRTGDDFVFGAIVSYACMDDYFLASGYTERECKEDGVWSGEAPVCEKTKYPPTIPDWGGKTIIISISIEINMEWNPSYGPCITNQCGDLVSNIKASLDLIFQSNLPCTCFTGTNIKSLSQGSVIADYDVEFDADQAIDAYGQNAASELANQTKYVVALIDDITIGDKTYTTDEGHRESVVEGLDNYIPDYCVAIPDICSAGYKCQQTTPTDGNYLDGVRCYHSCETHTCDLDNGECYLNPNYEPDCRCISGYFMSSNTCISNALLIGVIAGTLGAILLVVAIIVIVQLYRRKYTRKGSLISRRSSLESLMKEPIYSDSDLHPVLFEGYFGKNPSPSDNKGYATDEPLHRNDTATSEKPYVSTIPVTYNEATGQYGLHGEAMIHTYKGQNTFDNKQQDVDPSTDYF